MDIKNLFKKAISSLPTNNKQAQIMKPKNYYQDLINPYQLSFNPSFLEVNEEKLIDYFVLNDMS